MALSSYYISVNRKDLAERAIVAKREQEILRAQKCEAVASYHRDLALKSAKYRTLEELQPSNSSRASEESRIKERIKAAKQERLEIRQRKLAHLLTIENDRYMKELKEKADFEREKDPWNISRLKQQINELQKKRKEGEENIQRRYMHHLFKCSDPCIKESEETILEKEFMDSWTHRKEEMEKAALERLEKAKQQRDALEFKRLAAIQEIQDIDRKIKEENERFSENANQNKLELDMTKIESKSMWREEQKLNELLDKMDAFIQTRKQIRDIQSKEARIVSLWHPQERIRRMGMEILHGLKSDLNTLNAITSFTEASEDGKISVQLDLSQVPPVKEILEAQVSVEKERLSDTHHLYHEEATKLWGAKYSVWMEEMTKRDQLLHELLESIKSQIKEKLSSNQENQRRVLEMQKGYMQQIESGEEVMSEVSKELVEKKQYFLDQVKALDEQLEIYNMQNFERKTD